MRHTDVIEHVTVTYTKLLNVQGVSDFEYEK